MLIAAICCVLLIIVLGYCFGRRCPKCKKLAALKQTNRVLTGERPTTKEIKKSIKNNKGEVIGTTTETVPATECTYRIDWECKFCGYRHSTSKTETH